MFSKLCSISALLIALPLTSAACTREALLATAAKFVAAVSAGNITSLPFSTANFTYQENNKIADLKRAAIFSQPLKVDLTRSTADTVACASYTLIISSSGTKPYILATQLRHETDSNPEIISLVDTIAATTGSLFFNAKKTLEYIQKENWTPITPETDRPSRELLKKVGDAYLDMWTDANAAGSIPWGTDCERVEGSQYTRPCGAQLPRGGSKTNNVKRRYVIDEVVGSVDVLCSFDALAPTVYPDSHEIRVEGGKVKYVHTVTV
ncbi:hypothetical protein QBC35DRAFT_211259 [Podospora australis]|uniref:DUF8021 domain-containing protein n=1 Tax=Podospora australis TaxID=1536484 RepID=A0AAN7AGU1_9PEZI|nr:hypothetical protein QBC35DRAFT_211259 [Podospora australis]